MRSIKTKLIVAVSALVIFLFSVTAFLLIKEKKNELSVDIYHRARSVSELTTPKIIDLYRDFLAEKSFVIFNREIKDIFRKDEDISAIRIFTFAGEAVYDSTLEQNRQYEGEDRSIRDSEVLARVKANLPSFALVSSRLVYLKKESSGLYQSVDSNEREIQAIAPEEFIKNIVHPFEGKFAVQFELTYENLQARIIRTTQRILLLLIFGILLGLSFGWYFSQRITKPIESLTKGALILAKGDFTSRVKVATQDEVGVLAQTFNKMAGDLEISTKALIYKERVAKELEVAANIQKQILPEHLPQIPGLDLAAAVIPAAEIGGDCYDVIPVDKETHLLYISDVTGHGVPSGIVVSIANALIYSYAKSPSLSDILINANRVLKEKTSSNMFMTVLMLRFEKGKLSYVSAGHPEMLHYSLANKKVVQEKGGGIALGMVPDISKMVTELSIPFETGDVLLLYSDGIPEALSERQEQYGLQRLKRAMSEHGELESAEAIKNALLADVEEFMGKASQMDDITLMVIRRT